MRIFLRIAGIVIAVSSLLLLLAVPVAGVVFLIIGALFIFLSIKLPKKSDVPKNQPDSKDEGIPFSWKRGREPFFHKEDGEIRDVAKLCIDKPDNGPEVIYILDAWLKSNGELDVQKREVFETTEDAKERFKYMCYKSIKNDVRMEVLGLSAYKEWFYK
jgi:hypothetical protein